MGMLFGWSWKRQAAVLARSLIIILAAVAGFPARPFAQQDGGQAGLTREVSKAKMPEGKTAQMIRGSHTANSRTQRHAQRKEIPLRIPAGHAELRRLKSQPGLENQAEPVVPPARPPH